MRIRTVAATAASSAVVAALALPALAQGASLTVTGDAGNPVPLTPGTPTAIRNMDVSIGAVFAANERYYTLSIAGPLGPAASTSTCFSAGSVAKAVDYQGNGTYTATITTYPENDFNCATPITTTSAQYIVRAGVVITPPGGKLLTRRPNEFSSIDYAVPIALNPGALSYEVRLARGGVLAPDGSISGASEELFVDTGTGRISARFERPGTYLMVARAKAFSGSAGQFFSPWSAPVTVTALAPFDFQSDPTFPDNRGPRYKLRVALRERAATGKVRIKAARGKRGRYKSLGKARIRRGKFTKRFTLRGTGRYRMKFIYKGNALVAGGKVTYKFRIRRRVFF